MIYPSLRRKNSLAALDAKERQVSSMIELPQAADAPAELYTRSGRNPSIAGTSNG
jgi:hypothetical protein